MATRARRRSSFYREVGSALLAALLPACYSGLSLDDDGGPGGAASAGDDPDGAPGTGDGGGGDTGGDEPEALCAEPTVGPAQLRRLTRTEYNNTVRDLFGVTSQPADVLVGDTRIGFFDGNAGVGAEVTTLLVEQIATVAQDVVAQTDLQALLPCDPELDGEQACAQAYIAELGPRVYRRPLSDEDAQSLYAVFEAAPPEDGFVDRIALVTEAMLQSPRFLYHIEIGEPTHDGLTLALTDYELASRLSFFLWKTTPDDALLQAAERGELHTRDQLQEEAERMLDDPRFDDAIASFYGQWLGYRQLPEVPKQLPEADAALLRAMKEETNRFVSHVLREGDGRFETLLTASYTFVDPTLAGLYGIEYTGVADEFVQVDLDPQQRAGLLTQPSVMTVLSSPTQSQPVHRGVMVLRNVLCRGIPEPPADLEIEPLPEVVPEGKTRREILEEQTSVAPCSGCHVQINPPGFALENYDALGRYRDEDNGLPIDASGDLVGVGEFDGPRGFAEKLAVSEDARACASWAWLQFAIGRMPDHDADACSMEVIDAQFAESDYEITALLLAIVRSDAFRYRDRPQM